jgi:hypothetical protein
MTVAPRFVRMLLSTSWAHCEPVYKRAGVHTISPSKTRYLRMLVRVRPRRQRGNPRPDAFGLRADYDGPQPARNHQGIHDGVVADPRRARLLVSLSTLCLAISRDKSDR